MLTCTLEGISHLERITGSDQHGTAIGRWRVQTLRDRETTFTKSSFPAPTCGCFVLAPPAGKVETPRPACSPREIRGGSTCSLIPWRPGDRAAIRPSGSAICSASSTRSSSFCGSAMRAAANASRSGPGHGMFARRCRDAGMRYRAIERNPTFHRVLAAPGFDVIRGTAPPLPYDDGEADLASLMTVLERVHRVLGRRPFCGRRDLSSQIFASSFDPGAPLRPHP